jgi:dolichol-phosphate mannosyltransferase
VPERPPRLSILLPVRNEGSSLKVLLRILPGATDAPHEVLVIYDDLDDDSVPVVEAFAPRYPGLRALHNDRGRGLPNALRAGVAAARGDVILVFAADDITPFAAIDDMLGLIARGCDFVASTRYAHGGRRIGGHPVGAILSRAASRLYHALSGSVLTDLTSGRVMFRRDLFERFELRAPPVGWVVTFEMTMKAEILGLRLGEVPIVSVDRIFGGRSTFRLGSWTMEYLRWLAWGVTQLRRRGARPAPLRPAQ